MRFATLLLGVLIALSTRVAHAEVVRIGTLPGLRYDISAFSVKPGEEVEVVFSNTDEMLHNFVVTKPGARVAVVEAALALGAGAADVDYVPTSPDVLWATKVVQSGAAASLKFTAPATLGEYPYVCTFPGHGYVMFGTMLVTHNPSPPTFAPKELPSTETSTSTHDGHQPAPLTRASVQRIFMPDSGPASIAVQLPGGYSYCWDAGACRFRYAWKGGEPIERAERGTAKILGGEIFYRGEPSFPLRVGHDPSIVPREIAFKGYTLDANGIPEFEYIVDHVNVRERIEIRDGRVTRRFRTNGKTIWLSVPPEDEPRIATTGVREGEFHKLTGAAAQEFTITYTPAAK